MGKINKSYFLEKKPKHDWIQTVHEWSLDGAFADIFTQMRNPNWSSLQDLILTIGSYFNF